MTRVDCAEHRPYLAAIADRELDLVPAATREHLLACDECSAELAAHQLLGQRLRAAARSAAVPPERRRSWVGRLAPLAVAAAAAVALVSFELVNMSRPDPALAAAVVVANRQPEYRSSDPAELARWCTVQYGNRVPMVAVAGLEPQGARMDWPQDVGIATVTYVMNGQTVHISWLAKPLGAAQPAEETIDGHPAVVVRAHGVTAVVTGSAPAPDLLRIAREIAA